MNASDVDLIALKHLETLATELRAHGLRPQVSIPRDGPCSLVVGGGESREPQKAVLAAKLGNRWQYIWQLGEPIAAVTDTARTAKRVIRQLNRAARKLTS